MMEKVTTAGQTASGAQPDRYLSGVAFVIAVVIAAWLRFEQLGEKLLHHDESVNGWFLLRLIGEGEYRYNPDNYHGPSLYYLAILPLRLLGESEVALRFVPASFGVLAVGLIWLLRRRLGPIGTPGAALLMALSAGLVYYSRDFIHEMIFGCLTLGLVTGAVRYGDERRRRWLILSATSLGLLFATKETAIIALPILILSIAMAILFDLVRRGERLEWSVVRVTWPAADHLMAGAVIFLVLNLALYSSFLTHPEGIIDALRSPWRWTMRSGSEHVKGFWYYGAILVKLELPLLLGAITGGAFILWRGTRFWLFVGAWTCGNFLAYSLIGYKTPWLVVNTLVPMTLLAGHAIQRIFDLIAPSLLRLSFAIILLGGLAFSARLTREISLANYDDNQNRTGFLAGYGRRLGLHLYQDELVGYVYAQTDRDLRNLLNLIESQSRVDDKETGIYIASPDYWPLPWYLRNQPGVNYGGNLPPFDPSGNPEIGHRLIIARTDQLSAFSNATGLSVSPTSYNLRPGVALILLLRGDLKLESELPQ